VNSRVYDDDGNAQQTGRPKWSTLAESAAIIIPLLYVISRVLWAVGVPFGIKESRMDELSLPGTGSISLVLLSLPVLATAWFTFRFAIQYGRTMPQWIPILGGGIPKQRMVVGFLLVPVLILTYANAMNLIVLSTDLAPPNDMASLPTWSLWAHIILFLAWWAALVFVTARFWLRGG
jgi:hypothetical protein